MNRLSWPRAVCLLCAALFMLGGCATKSVQVVDEAEFNLMGRRITTLLQQRNILDSEGGYAASLIPIHSFPSPVGETLFTGLSPAFRFQLDPNLVPPSFASSRAPQDVVEFMTSGFRLTQGPDVVTVKLLGAADWNNDGSVEWFVLCRVLSGVINAQRDYYLVISDTGVRPMKSELAAVYDCRSSQCFLYVEETPGKQPAYSPESRIVELEQGQRSIVPPPGAETLEDPEKPSLQESKLGN